MLRGLLTGGNRANGGQLKRPKGPEGPEGESRWCGDDGFAGCQPAIQQPAKLLRYGSAAACGKSIWRCDLNQREYSVRVEIALPTLAKARGNFGLEVTRSMVKVFVSVCHALLDWERNELAPGADEKIQQQHRAALKRLLRLARALHAEASDPDYPDPTAAAEVQAIIWKLNESWQRFYNAMPEAQADAILRECFPGHGS